MHDRRRFRCIGDQPGYQAHGPGLREAIIVEYVAAEHGTRPKASTPEVTVRRLQEHLGDHQYEWRVVAAYQLKPSRRWVPLLRYAALAATGAAAGIASSHWGWW